MPRHLRTANGTELCATPTGPYMHPVSATDDRCYVCAEQAHANPSGVGRLPWDAADLRTKGWT